MVLIIKNISVEGPGMIAHVLEDRGYSLKIIDLERGDVLPNDLAGVEAIVVLGGPMNVYEEEKYLCLKGEDILIRAALAKNVPFLGVCLGAQLLAKAAGAQIRKNPDKEIGFYKINLSADSKGDTLFDGVAPEIDVFQWHGDTFDIPAGGVRLASSELCRNQAFRIGEKAYGLQFHVEVDDMIIKEWLDKYADSEDCPSAKWVEKRFRVDDEVREDLRQNGLKILGNFASIIGKEAIG